MRSSSVYRPDWLALMTLVRLSVGGGILGAATFDLAARLAGHQTGSIDAVGAVIGILAAVAALCRVKAV
jgi:uncharacterized membrane protein YuzA (DUF378 family)